MTGLHGSRARPAPVLSLGLQRRAAAASFLLLCQAQRKLGRLACSAHTMPGPHLPHTSGAAVGRHICCLSLHCQGALVVTAAAAAVSGLVPRLRDFKSPTVPVLCPQKERLKDLFLAMELAPLRPAFGQTAAALLWAYCKCLHWCLAGISLQASRKGVVGLSPGFGWTTLQRDKVGLLTLEAQNPWGHLSHVLELLPYPLSSPPLPPPSPCPLPRAQPLLSPVPGAWVLCPLCQDPRSPRHWGRGQSTAAEARAPYSSQLPLGMPVTLGQTNTLNACVSVRCAGSHHRQWLLPDVLTCPFIAAAVSPSMAPQQLLMCP